MFIFDGLKSLLPKFHTTTIDNHAFRLHYRITVLILVAFIILHTAKEYFGTPIRCTTIDKSVPKDILDQFCWVQSTYSLPDFWHHSIGDEIPYPGVGLHKKGMPQVYHKYYQWVVFMLFLQAILFYIPRYIWKMWEGGKIRMLSNGLENPLMDANEKQHNLNLLSSYLSSRQNNHTVYILSYFFSEFLNLVNIIGQIYLTDRFLGNEFTKFGWKVLEFIATDQQNRTDPMAILFPRMSKCMYYKFGFGGNIENKDAICILPLNIVNEKIYVFLWYWFILLAFFTTCALIYRILTMAVPSFRVFLLKRRATFVNKDTIDRFLSKRSLGDWFLLYLLSKNIDPIHFKDLMNNLNGKSNILNGEKPSAPFHNEKNVVSVTTNVSSQ